QAFLLRSIVHPLVERLEDLLSAPPGGADEEYEAEFLFVSGVASIEATLDVIIDPEPGLFGSAHLRVSVIALGALADPRMALERSVGLRLRPRIWELLGRCRQRVDRSVRPGPGDRGGPA